MTAGLDANGQDRVLRTLAYVKALAQGFPMIEDAESKATLRLCELVASHPEETDHYYRNNIVWMFTDDMRRAKTRATEVLRDPVAKHSGPSVYKAIAELKEPWHTVAEKLWIQGTPLTASERQRIPETRRRLIKLLEDQV